MSRRTAVNEPSSTMKAAMAFIGVGFVIAIGMYLFGGDVDKSGQAIHIEGYRDDCLTPWEKSLLLTEHQGNYELYKKYSNRPDCNYKTMNISGGEIRKRNALAMKEYNKRGYGES